MSIDKPEIDFPGGEPPADLEITDVWEGDGAGAKAGDTVQVHYVGVAYSTGEEFDASWNRGDPLEFRLGVGQVIAGWDQGVQGMRVGGRRQLVIPPGPGVRRPRCRTLDRAGGDADLRLRPRLGLTGRGRGLSRGASAKPRRSPRRHDPRRPARRLGFARRDSDLPGVGFGSHHWLAGDEQTVQLFVTVDDLVAKLRGAATATDACSAGWSVRSLSTVAAPRLRAWTSWWRRSRRPAAGCWRAWRPGTRWWCIPYLKHCQAGRDGGFACQRRPAGRARPAGRRSHGASAESAASRRLRSPRARRAWGRRWADSAPWQAGPYGTSARDLLAAHAAELTGLAGRLRRPGRPRRAQEPDRMVITHGEPHAANVLGRRAAS